MATSSIDYWQSKGHKMHYRTDEGQPYGSESRKCDICGTMIWPAMQGEKTPAFTEDRAEYEADPYRCSKKD
jgi:hypothetical protein